MKVLIVSHTSRVGGAERCLLDLLATLPGAVEPVVACPPGDLDDAVNRLGVRTVAIHSAETSLATRPLQTLRDLADVAAAARDVRRAAQAESADVIHANSVRAGLVATATPRRAMPPLVVQVHDCLPDDPVANAIRRVLGRRAAEIVANSHYTEANFRRDGSRARFRTVYQGIDLERFDRDAVDRAAARQRIDVAEGVPLLGVIAQFSSWKGQDLAVRALARVRTAFPDARLLLVGGVKFASRRFDNNAYVAGLRRVVTELDLADAVELLGERDDVPDLLRALDLLLVPSVEEPFGRVVVESLAMGTPVVATSVGGPAELVEDGRTGRLLEPRDPDVWGEVVVELLSEPDERERMGDAGVRAAAAFNRSAFAAAMLDAYRSALEPPKTVDPVYR